MPPTASQHAILKAAAQFRDILKYHGVMPRKHALAFPESDLSALVDRGLLEWAEFTYGCGKELRGVRITPEGTHLLDESAAPSEEAEASELAYEHMLILQDIFHFSRMPRYRRMMPAKKAQAYVSSDLEDLLNRGYVLKMKLKVEGERTLKGFVISPKGERALKKAGMDS
ncbi:hypothetical protein [Fundidesulfovibrio putealis]|uniref:hypothetical protein n=1 Tax=Fundidesulfovibrio putealis TaxID=270496 RepID=UPI00040BA4CB|nr:hypothetical protein [Fundidesulfovibrio putealis]